jgi:hypothetical protein
MTQLLQRASDIAAAIETRLAAVLVANGAETDLGRLVLRGRRIPEEDMIPCTVVIEGDDNPDQSTMLTKINNDQRYLLFAFIPCDPDHPNDAANAAIRDLKRAIFRTAGKPDIRWGNTVRRVRYAGRDIGPRADGAKFVCASIEFVVEYVEDLANP